MSTLVQVTKRTRGVSCAQCGPILRLREKQINVKANLILRLMSEIAGQKATIAALKEQLADAELAANTDTLTGIPNRSGFESQFARALARAGRSFGQPLSIAMFDLDHFKKINDTFGHPIGDEALRKVGVILRTYVRASDYAARVGGEEFAIILEEISPGQATVMMDRLRQRIEEELAVITPSGIAHATASFGVATWRPGEGAVELMGRADAAVYAAKGAGRNCVASAPHEDLICR